MDSHPSLPAVYQFFQATVVKVYLKEEKKNVINILSSEEKKYNVIRYVSWEALVLTSENLFSVCTACVSTKKVRCPYEFYFLWNLLFMSRLTSILDQKWTKDFVSPVENVFKRVRRRRRKKKPKLTGNSQPVVLTWYARMETSPYVTGSFHSMVNWCWDKLRHQIHGDAGGPGVWNSEEEMLRANHVKGVQGHQM